MADKSEKPTPRPHIGVHFKCCKVYARIYLTKDASAFAGNCPRCARPVRVRVAPGGSSDRFWTVD